MGVTNRREKRINFIDFLEQVPFFFDMHTSYTLSSNQMMFYRGNVEKSGSPNYDWGRLYLPSEEGGLNLD